MPEEPQSNTPGSIRSAAQLSTTPGAPAEQDLNALKWLASELISAAAPPFQASSQIGKDFLAETYRNTLKPPLPSSATREFAALCLRALSTPTYAVQRATPPDDLFADMRRKLERTAAHLLEWFDRECKPEIERLLKNNPTPHSAPPGLGLRLASTAQKEPSSDPAPADPSAPGTGLRPPAPSGVSVGTTSGPIDSSELTPKPPIQRPTPPPAPIPLVLIESFGCDSRRDLKDRYLCSRWNGEHAERVSRHIETMLTNDPPLSQMMFMRDVTSTNRKVVLANETSCSDRDIWFIGDIHGDLLAMEAALQTISQKSGPDRWSVVFLGDFIDDGAESCAVIARLFELVAEHPGRVCVLAGNHDEALSTTGQEFESSVTPSDFANSLNDPSDPDRGVKRGLADRFVEFIAMCPRAVLLPDGLLAVHAGVPHTDLHAEITSLDALASDRCLQDFVWTRLAERAKRRVPNRSVRGCEIGYQDFEAFCRIASAMLNRPVERVMRGHDHLEDRFGVFAAWVNNQAITINNMCTKLPREVFGPYVRMPAIARWCRGRLPEIYRLDLSEEFVREIYPEPIGASPLPNVSDSVSDRT